MLLLPCGACYILVHGELPTSLKATEHCTSWYAWMCWAQSPSGACLHCFQSLKAQTLKCTLAYITSHVKVATAFFARQNKISESKMYTYSCFIVNCCLLRWAEVTFVPNVHILCSFTSSCYQRQSAVDQMEHLFRLFCWMFSNRKEPKKPSLVV